MVLSVRFGNDCYLLSCSTVQRLSPQDLTHPFQLRSLQTEVALAGDAWMESQDVIRTVDFGFSEVKLEGLPCA